MRGKKQNVRLWAVVFWLVVWQVAAMALHAAYPHGALLLPSPLAALARLMALAGTAAFWRAVGLSSLHILGGFLLSCVLAVILAALSARDRRVEELLAPLVMLVKTVPVASFIILALVWLSSKTLPLFIAALMVFPPVYLNVLEGVRCTDASLLEMARVFKLSRWRTFMYVYRPAFMPFLVASSRISLGMSWKSGIMAEVLATPKPSIGKEMATARTFLDTPDLLAWTVVVMVASVPL